MLNKQPTIYLATEPDNMQYEQASDVLDSTLMFFFNLLPAVSPATGITFFSNQQEKEATLRLRSAIQRFKRDLVNKETTGSVPTDFLFYFLTSNFEGEESIYESLRSDTLPNSDYYQKKLDVFLYEKFGYTLSKQSRELQAVAAQSV